MTRPPPLTTESNRTVMVRGQAQPYLERVRIRRRDYFLLEQVGNSLRQRFRAFDPYAGPGGDFFLVLRLPSGPRTEHDLRILHKLKHDSLPRVVEWQRTEDGIDAALSWVDGVSLADYLQHLKTKQRPHVSPQEAVRLIHGLANGVCQLHRSLQMTHGDIQPANVIVTGHSSRLALIDFGNAWTQQMSAVREEGDGHHRCYAAPESQTQLTPVGFLADQFSVAVLFYRLLTLQLPYGGYGGKAGRPEYISRMRDALIPPSRLLPSRNQLPRSLLDGLDRVAMRGLALDPTQRYPDRHAWLNDLFELLARFRVPPELPPGEDLLTRVIEWFIRRRRSD